MNLLCLKAVWNNVKLSTPETLFYVHDANRTGLKIAMSINKGALWTDFIDVLNKYTYGLQQNPRVLQK